MRDALQAVAAPLAGERFLSPPTVAIGGATYPLMVDRPFRFGRRDHLDVVGLDPTDNGISRTAGELLARDGFVTLTNTSRKRPLHVEYPDVVRRVRIGPCGTYVFTGPSLLLVPGDVWTHPLHVTAASNPAPLVASVEGEVTNNTSLTATEREAIAAVADSYLARWPHHDEHPLPYADAARIAGLDETTLRRRVEHLRGRLNASSSMNATGPHAVRTLVEQLIDAGVLGVADRLQGERAR